MWRPLCLPSRSLRALAVWVFVRASFGGFHRLLGHRGVGVPDPEALPRHVGPDQCGVDMHHLAARDPCSHTRLHGADEHGAEPIGAPPLADAGQARMVRQHVGQTETREPADRDVDLSLAHQAPVVDDADQEAGQHEPQCHLGIDAWPPGAIGRVALAHLCSEPTEVEHLVHPGEHMVVGNEVSKRARYQQLRLTPRFASQHRAPHRIVAGTSESETKGFFNSPTRQRCHEALTTRRIARLEPFVRVGDDELDAAQAAPDQALEECRPDDPMATSIST